MCSNILCLDLAISNGLRVLAKKTKKTTKSKLVALDQVPQCRAPAPAPAPTVVCSVRWFSCCFFFEPGKSCRSPHSRNIFFLCVAQQVSLVRFLRPRPKSQATCEQRFPATTCYLLLLLLLLQLLFIHLTSNALKGNGATSSNRHWQQVTATTASRLCYNDNSSSIVETKLAMLGEKIPCK